MQTRVGLVCNPSNPGAMLQANGMEDAARALGLRVTRGEANNPEQFQRAFARFSAEGVNGVVFAADPTIVGHAAVITDLARAARVPTIFQRRENVEAGGLLSYGANLPGQIVKYGCICRSHIEGRKARQPSGRAANPFRISGQS